MKLTPDHPHAGHVLVHHHPGVPQHLRPCHWALQAARVAGPLPGTTYIFIRSVYPYRYYIVYCTVHIMYAFRAYQKGGPGTVNMMGTQYSLLFTHVIRSKGFKHYAARPWDIFSRKVGTYSRHTYIYSMVENSVADPFFVCYSWANFWERPDPFLLYLSRLLRTSGSFIKEEDWKENVLNFTEVYKCL